MRALRDLGPHREQLALAQIGVDDRDRAVQFLLADRPAAAQGRLALEPCHLLRRGAGQRERLAFVEEDIDRRRHAVRQRLARIDPGGEQRARDVELLLVERGERPVRLLRHQRGLDLRIEQGRQPVRAADRQHRATRLCKRRDRRQCLLGRHLAQPTAIVGRDVLGVGHPEPIAARIRPARCRRHGAVGEQQHVVLRVQVPGVELLRIDHAERELVLLQKPSRPAGRNDAAIAIDQPDTDRLQRQLGTGGRAAHRIGVDPELLRRRCQDSTRGRRRRDPDRAGRQILATRLGRALDPGRRHARLQQSVGQHEAVVRLMPDDPARLARPDHAAGGDRQQVGHALERARETVEHAIEIHAHLVRQRIAGDVVRRLGRAAGEFGIVRMILRLEHVDHVRAIGLRGLHDVRPRRIALAAGRERRGRAVDIDAVLDQRVEERDRRRHVALVGRQHIAARVALRRVLQHLGVQR